MEYSNTGKAIAQLIIIPCEQPNVQEAQELSSTSRKGGFGSTNVDTISSHPGKLVFKGTIKGKTLHFIIDSGADGIFAGQNMIEEAGLATSILKKPVVITTADGEEHTITHIAKKVPYSIQGFQDKINILIMPVDNDQIILGNHWLSHLNPIVNCCFYCGLASILARPPRIGRQQKG